MSTISSVSHPIYADTAATGSTATSSISSSSSTSTTSSDQTVSTADFMKLLVAQLQNQDPTSPQDNQQFVTQLATFNSLDQLISINSNTTKLADGTTTSGTTTGVTNTSSSSS